MILRQLRWTIAVGAALGVLLFAAEAALMIRSGAVGFKVDIDGPAAAMKSGQRRSTEASSR